MPKKNWRDMKLKPKRRGRYAGFKPTPSNSNRHGLPPGMQQVNEPEIGLFDPCMEPGENHCLHEHYLAKMAVGIKCCRCGRAWIPGTADAIGTEVP